MEGVLINFDFDGLQSLISSTAKIRGEGED